MPQSLDTRAIHAGEEPRVGGAAILPIFQSSVFECREDLAEPEVRYPRYSNLPNQRALAKKIADLEGAEDAIVTASGMAAIASTLLSVLAPQGHLLVQDAVYGGVFELLERDFRNLGLCYDFIDATKPETWRSRVTSNTRAIYVEAVTNPTLQVADHRAVVNFAQDHDLVAIIDNTFATPVNFRPIELGYTFSIHSGTKYLNGHSDLVAGALAGPAAPVECVRQTVSRMGGSLDPHACFLFQRGLKTLPLRMQKHEVNARALGRFLVGHPEVLLVHYPGLEENSEHSRAREVFTGFGGMLSFELKGGVEAARRLLGALEIPLCAPSLGGLETLITRPVTTSHRHMEAAHRRRIGVSDELLRVSVGIEGTEDLIADFTQALEKVR